MRILALKPGHDGALAGLADGRLLFSFEGEKNSLPRYAVMQVTSLVSAHAAMQDFPDVVTVGGWPCPTSPRQANYYGLAPETVIRGETEWFGRRVKYFSSSHERAHIMQAYGMSPYEQGRPVYVIVLEGSIGKAYEIDKAGLIHDRGLILSEPGRRYALLFYSAVGGGHFNDSLFPGKQMALAAYGKRNVLSAEEEAAIDRLIDSREDLPQLVEHRNELASAGLDVESQTFKDMARSLSDKIFDLFYRFAKRELTRGWPLLISGGCGLNCEWNTRWRNSGLFDGVFVAPCVNDSGSAIGTAVDAQFHYTGSAKIEWSPYAGEDFIVDDIDCARYDVSTLDYRRVAGILARGGVLGWVQGRYEIGPRALGNRSIIAAPFSSAVHERLNAIKEREGYRPIAPVCLEEDLALHFLDAHPSPHMLHFFMARARDLRAVTHVDGSARVQSVTREQNEPLHTLLRSFKALTGVGVLCNTSLNFKSHGFINELSHLARFQQQRDLDGFVALDKLYLAKGRFSE